MCGRFFSHQPREDAAASFRAVVGDASEHPSYNVAPTDTVLTVRFHQQSGERTLDDAHWGLIPHFATDKKIAWRTINARAETIDKSAVFRVAFAKRRCLVVADGFYEWKSVGRKKQPFAIALASGKPFGLAGLWENWQDPETGEWLRSCSIITTKPNELVARVHDRMPVIIDPADYATWLGETPATKDELKALLKPYGGELKMWPVSPQMNKPGGVDDATVLARVDFPELPPVGEGKPSSK